jgi:hypothetical protein
VGDLLCPRGRSGGLSSEEPMATLTLLLSFTASSLTVWMRVRCFRVVGDCRRRSLCDAGDGVECAMKWFDAEVIVPASKVAVSEITRLKWWPPKVRSDGFFV